MKRFFKNENGAAAAEYALILALVATGIIASAIQLGSSINSTTYGVARVMGTSSAASGTSSSSSGGGSRGTGMHASN